MNWRLFGISFAVLFAFGAVALLSAWRNGWLTQGQIKEYGTTAIYSLLQYGGMWVYLLAIPMMSYIVGRYKLPYFSTTLDRVWFFVAIAVGVTAGYMYERSGFTQLTHIGRTTIVDWILCLGIVAGTWIIGLMYLHAKELSVSPEKLVIMSVLLTLFFVVGVMNFSRHWTWTPAVLFQVALEAVLAWGATVVQAWRMWHG